MNEPVLVVLAAGLGSRYGGLKQIDSIGDKGETIIDFSIYDAYRAGFRKVVLIIKREHVSLFDEHIGNKIRPFMDVEYAFQDVEELPEPFVCPETRKKPWGTVHALMCTEEYVDTPFMVINADDFYGKESYEIMYNFLKNEITDECFGMVGYQLGKTLTANGTVTRGLCQVENGHLTGIQEIQKIKAVDETICEELADGSLNPLPLNSLASMNFWGFTPAIYPLLKEKMVQFLTNNIDSEKAEYVIPTVIGELLNEQKTAVKVFSTTAEWFGVTYPQDRKNVQNKMIQYKQTGLYPADLWK